jgi:hypothetical protein
MWGAPLCNAANYLYRNGNPPFADDFFGVDPLFSLVLFQRGGKPQSAVLAY